MRPMTIAGVLWPRDRGSLNRPSIGPQERGGIAMGARRFVLAGLLLAGGLCGCQCCSLFDHYADTIDCIATKECNFDRFYCPCLDLTRIGRPDWCQCGFNRALCPCACARLKPLPHIVEPPIPYFQGAPGPWGPHPEPLSTKPEGIDGAELDEALDATIVPDEAYRQSPIFELPPVWPEVTPPGERPEGSL